MLGIAHRVAPSDIDETVLPGEDPERYTKRLAQAKALAVHTLNDKEIVLGADTSVVLNGTILGKPRDEVEAREMLKQLAGQCHEVISAVAVVSGPRVEEACDRTRVQFRRMSDDVIDTYVATGEPLDKAGSYGIQGYGAALVDRIEGDFFGVMGLPVRLVLEVLERLGHTYMFTR